MVSVDDFDQWRDNPVTRWVMEAATKAAEANKTAWVDASWETGACDPIVLTELRTRADAYRALADTEFEAWQQIHGDVDE